MRQRTASAKTEWQRQPAATPWVSACNFTTEHATTGQLHAQHKCSNNKLLLWSIKMHELFRNTKYFTKQWKYFIHLRCKELLTFSYRWWTAKPNMYPRTSICVFHYLPEIIYGDANVDILTFYSKQWYRKDKMRKCGKIYRKYIRELYEWCV